MGAALGEESNMALFLMIPVMLLGAAKYYLKHNQEVERIAVDYTYANSFPVLALSEMLMSICNLVLLVLIVLVFAQEYHSGQIRMVIQRSYTYSEVLIAKIITIVAVSLLFISVYFICSYCIGYIFFEHEPNILLFYHTEKRMHLACSYTVFLITELLILL